MADRPWILPADVRRYSEIESVRKRSHEKLLIDIGRAEEYIIQYTGNRFDGGEFPAIPAPVRTAALLLAEAYAHNAATSARLITKEKFDEYSYSAENSLVDVDGLNIAALLRDYVMTGKSDVKMKLRKL